MRILTLRACPAQNRSRRRRERQRDSACRWTRQEEVRIGGVRKDRRPAVDAGMLHVDLNRARQEPVRAMARNVAFSRIS